jgi:hypothetical protein
MHEKSSVDPGKNDDLSGLRQSGGGRGSETDGLVSIIHEMTVQVTGDESFGIERRAEYPAGRGEVLEKVRQTA